MAYVSMVFTSLGQKERGKRFWSTVKNEISGHLRIVLRVSRTSHYLFFWMMVPPAGSNQLCPQPGQHRHAPEDRQPFKQDNAGEQELFILAKGAGLHVSPFSAPLAHLCWKRSFMETQISK